MGDDGEKLLMIFIFPIKLVRSQFSRAYALMHVNVVQKTSLCDDMRIFLAIYFEFEGEP